MSDIVYHLNMFTDVGQPQCDCATNGKGNPLMLILGCAHYKTKI